jgi:copper chaperone CopZ
MERPSASIVVLVAIIVLVTALTACGRAQPVRASFTVEGMTCESCSGAITDTLSKIDGVVEVSADHILGSAVVVFLSPDATAEGLADEIESLGYTVTKTEIGAVEG